MPATGAARLPAALSARSVAVLARPVGPARVLAAFPTALYLHLDSHDAVLPVLAGDALALPIGLRTAVPAAALAWGARPGDTVPVGDGQVLLPALTVAAVRTWRPPRVGATPAASGLVRCAGPAWEGRSAARLLEGLAADRTSRLLRDLVADLVTAVRAGDGPDRHVHGLVGAGAGLTPSGDDALCGALLTLRACGVDPRRAAALRRSVAAASGRTTSLSAALLREAADGYAVPAVVALVSAVAGGQGAAVRAGLPEVLALGHSSGADLVAGVLGTLDALTTVTTRDRPVPVRRPQGAPP